MNIVQVPIEHLKPAEYNPRKLTKEQKDHLVKSIKDFGIVDPIIVNKYPGRENIIIGGHMRYVVAKELGYTELPVFYVELNEQREAELNLRLNKNTGEWNWDMLAHFDLNMLSDIGFTDHEIADHLQIDQDMPSADDDYDEQKAPAPTDIHPGDIFQLGAHRLMCGDSTNQEHVATLMNGKMAQMVFTDPPYNVDYQGGMNSEGQNKREGIMNDKMNSSQFYDFLYAAMKNMIAYCNGGMYVCMSSSELDTLSRAFTNAGGHMQSFLMWVKHTFTLSRADYQHQYEPILYGWPEGVIDHYFVGTRKQSNVWEDIAPRTKVNSDGDTEISLGEYKLKLKGKVEGTIIDKEQQTDIWREKKPTKSDEHPTMKPIRLVQRAIRNSSVQGDIVLDLFGGSGSTLIAADELKRTAYLMELDPRYVSVIINRWEQKTGGKSIRITEQKPSGFLSRMGINK
mgnify:CR=1 FL=1